jgi:hypothetical protein
MAQLLPLDTHMNAAGQSTTHRGARTTFHSHATATPHKHTAAAPWSLYIYHTNHKCTQDLYLYQLRKPTLALLTRALPANPRATHMLGGLLQRPHPVRTRNTAQLCAPPDAGGAWLSTSMRLVMHHTSQPQPQHAQPLSASCRTPMLAAVMQHAVHLAGLITSLAAALCCAHHTSLHEGLQGYARLRCCCCCCPASVAAIC